MMRAKSLIISTLLIAAVYSQVAAQSLFRSTEKHRFTVWLGAGYSRLDLATTGTKTLGLAGGLFGVGYGYALNINWRVNTGVEIAELTSLHTMPNFVDMRRMKDTDGMDFNMKYQFRKYQETAFATYIQVPLTVEYHQGRWFAALGGKIGLPVGANAVTAGTVKTTGIYDNLIGEFENMPNHYFTTTEVKTPASAKLGLNIIGTAELGLTLVGRKHEDVLRVSVFCDYGLTNLKKETNDSKIVDYGQNPLDIHLHARMFSADVSSIHSMLGGVKLIYLFKSIGTRNNGRCQSGMEFFRFRIPKFSLPREGNKHKMY